MNKVKRRDETIMDEVDHEIARWDPENADFVGLVLADIDRHEWDDEELKLVVEEVIALLEGDLDLEAKKKILCACDKSAGSTWEFMFNLNSQTIHRALPLDTLPRVFQSRLVPYEWKRNTLLKSMSRARAYERECGIPWIPTEFEGPQDDAPEAFRLIRGFCFNRPEDADFNELVRQLRELEQNEPGSVSRLVDCYGNNAHLYAFCQYWSTNYVNGMEGGEYWSYGIGLSNALTSLGCDPNQENVFGISRRDLRYGTGYVDGGLVTL